MLHYFVIGWYWYTKADGMFDPSSILFGLEEIDTCRGNIGAHKPFLGE